MNLTSEVCQHCGTNLSLTQSRFCCNGCEVVYNILSDLPEEERNLRKPEKLGRNNFEFLDQDDFRKSLNWTGQSKNQDGLQSFSAYISGVHCASCIKLLEEIPRIFPFVKSSELHFGENLLELQIEPNGSLSLVADLIQKMGYQPHFLRPQQSTRQLVIQENRADLIRLGIAGAIAANIMLLSISIYGGLQGTIAQWFNWLQFFIFLPLVFYSAIPFYKGALRGLRYKQISIDLPITVALILSFVLSTASLLKDGDALYFDSTASFIFLILISRYMTKRLTQKGQELSLFSEFIEEKGVLCKTENSTTLKPIALIKTDDIIVLKKGDRIPADGVLLSENAAVDMSVLTGESDPKTVLKGMDLLAGSRVFSNEIEIKVKKSGEETYLGQLLTEVKHLQQKRTPLVFMSDKASQILLGVVLAIAALFFVSNYSTDSKVAFERALALVVVACPCALALGTPMALSQALKKATRLGIVIRSADVFEKIPKVTTAAFDKTGTLTWGKLSLSNSPLMSIELKSIILTLESQSHHPIAFALREIWPQVPLLKAKDIVETPGLGVQGIIENSFYEIKKDSSLAAGSGPQMALFKDGRKLFALEFSDDIRMESQALIEYFKNHHIESFMVSGDHKSSALRVASRVGIPAENVFYDLSPSDKKKTLMDKKNCVMIGDGANDTLGMSEAFLSIAVRGSVYEALKAADVFLADDNLNTISKLFSLGYETQSVLKRNILIALIYNSLAGAAALLGFIGPLGAAVLMPISSAAIILSSFWGTKKMRQLKQENIQEKDDTLNGPSLESKFTNPMSKSNQERMA